MISTREDLTDEEQKDITIRELKIKFMARQFKEREDWKKGLFKLKKFKVIKLARIFQSLFYLLGYQREQICEKGTNKLDWKKAKTLINESFIDRLINYQVTGPKSGDFSGYRSLNFVE